jgi:hypothetical protein
MPTNPASQPSGNSADDELLADHRGAGKDKKDAVIDGEFVALDEHGVSRFQMLQNAPWQGKRTGPASFGWLLVRSSS